jgi:type IV pilus assembly protein PilO
VSRLKQNPKVAFGAGAAALVLLLVASWFLLVAPKRSEAAEVEQQVAAKQVELANKRAALADPSANLQVKASDLYRLTKALPDSTDMAGILLDVNRLAAKNSLGFRSVTPGTPEVGADSMSVPLILTVQGRFTSVSGFLRDVRTLVRVRNGRLDARGRTYSVSQLDLGPPDEQKYPTVKATITVRAHSFVTPAPAAPATPSTSPPASSDGGTVAAGATP